jgi:hypothetical protein
MTIQPGGAVRELCATADEALRQASFCTGEFAEAERLFSDAAAAATRDGDTASLARATSGCSQAPWSSSATPNSPREILNRPSRC